MNRRKQPRWLPSVELFVCSYFRCYSCWDWRISRTNGVCRCRRGQQAEQAFSFIRLKKASDEYSTFSIWPVYVYRATVCMKTWKGSNDCLNRSIFAFKRFVDNTDCSCPGDMRFFLFCIILAKYDYGAVDNYIRTTSVRMRANDLSHSLSFMNKANALFFCQQLCLRCVRWRWTHLHLHVFRCAPKCLQYTLQRPDTLGIT